MPRSRSRLNLKLLLVAIACIGVYLNVWKVHSETVATRSLRDLEFGSVESRRAAALTLGESILEEGARAIPALAKAAIGDSDEQVRFNAIVALGDNAGPNETAADALIVTLKRGSPRIRARSAQGLSTTSILPQVPLALIEALKDDLSDVRAEAASALAVNKDGWEKVETALMAARKDADAEVRARVLSALTARSRTEPPAPKGGPKVVSVIQSLARNIIKTPRWAARYQTAMMGGLKDPSVRVRRVAVQALADVPFFGFAESASLTTAEIAALADSDAEVRAAAATSLGVVRQATKIDGRAPEEMTNAVLALLAAMGDGDGRVRRSAGLAISGACRNLGIPSVEAEDAIRAALIAALEGRTPEHRVQAVAAAPVVTSVLTGGSTLLFERYAIAARDADPRVREAAVVGLVQGFSRAEMQYQQPRYAMRNTLLRSFFVCVKRPQLVNILSLYELMKVYRSSPAEYLFLYSKCDPESLDAFLRPLCDDPDPHVRRQAYAGLWRLHAFLGDGNKERRTLLDRLWRAYLNDLGSAMAIEREAAAWALQWVPSEYVAATRDALRAHENDVVRDVRNRIGYVLKYSFGAPNRMPTDPWWGKWERSL